MQRSWEERMAGLGAAGEENVPGAGETVAGIWQGVSLIVGEERAEAKDLTAKHPIFETAAEYTLENLVNHAKEEILEEDKKRRESKYPWNSEPANMAYDL